MLCDARVGVSVHAFTVSMYIFFYSIYLYISVFIYQFISSYLFTSLFIFSISIHSLIDLISLFIH